MRIILLATITGLVFATIILFVLRATEDHPPDPQSPILTYIAIPFAAVVLIAHAFVPNRAVVAARRRLAQQYPQNYPAPVHAPSDPNWPWAFIYQTRLIIGMAILEGLGFYLAIVYNREGNPLTLVGAGVIVALLAMKFPTRAGIERWIERQQELLEQERAAR
jgi:hypothetical protein